MGQINPACNFKPQFNITAFSPTNSLNFILHSRLPATIFYAFIISLMRVAWSPHRILFCLQSLQNMLWKVHLLCIKHYLVSQVYIVRSCNTFLISGNLISQFYFGFKVYCLLHYTCDSWEVRKILLPYGFTQFLVKVFFSTWFTSQGPCHNSF
jgi:hypothetical protein